MGKKNERNFKSAKAFHFTYSQEIDYKEKVKPQMIVNCKEIQETDNILKQNSKP